MSINKLSKHWERQVTAMEQQCSCHFSSSLGSGSLSLSGGSLGALSETVLCSSIHMFQVSHSASSLGVSPLGLLGPVVYIPSTHSWLTSPLLGAGVTTRSASLLLSVPALFTVDSAQSVGVVVATTHGWSTLGLNNEGGWGDMNLLTISPLK